MASPYLKFYTRDWRSDTRLRASSFAARGLWVDLITLMHEADPYGFLIVAGQRCGVADVVTIAAQLGVTPATVRRPLLELVELGVCSVDEYGTIFSRRMVRDEQRRRQSSEYGRLGGGSPALKQPINPPYKATSKARGDERDRAPSRERDRDPDTRDQKPETASPSGARTREDADGPLDDDAIDLGEKRPVHGPSLDFATWFVQAALAAGAIPQHNAMLVADLALRQEPDARPLVETYPRAELEARSRRLFARKTDVTDPLRYACSIATLAARWDWFGAPKPAARANGKAAVAGEIPRYNGDPSTLR